MLQLYTDINFDTLLKERNFYQAFILQFLFKLIFHSYHGHLLQKKQSQILNVSMMHS